MTDNHLIHKQLTILVTFFVACSLLFIGMRVPDLTRPHRPKPSQRAVIESPVETSQQGVTKSVDLFAIMAKPAEHQTLLPLRTLSLIHI